MATKREIIEKLQALKPMLQSSYAIKRIGIFGSFAADNATEESDIDLLVELEHPIGWKFFTLEIMLEKTFGRKIDLVTPNALKRQLKEQILSTVQYI